MTVDVDPVFRGRVFVFSSWSNVFDFSLPHLYLITAYYALISRNRALGGVSALLGIKSYLEVTQAYHLHWKGATALMCVAYLYAALKLGELGIVMLTHSEADYDNQDPKVKSPHTIREKILWSAAACGNLRCIGFKGGKREYAIPKPSPAAILLPAFWSLGTVDILTSVIHHLSLYNGHLNFAMRPIWQQLSTSGLIAWSLYALFTGIYGVLQFIGIYGLDMSPSQWPPMLNRPWAATSLTQFWSREWHSVFRRIFVFYTDLVMRFVRSRFVMSPKVKAAVTIMFVFLMSALLHDFGLYLYQRQHTLRTVLFFLIQGPAIILEQRFNLGKSPVLGALWTYTFLLLTSGPIGMVGDMVDYGSPSTLLTDGFFRDISVTARIVNYVFGTAL